MTEERGRTWLSLLLVAIAAGALLASDVVGGGAFFRKAFGKAGASADSAATESKSRAERPSPKSSSADPSAASPTEASQISVLETEYFRATVASRYGGVASFVLKKDRFRKRGGDKPLDLVSTSRDEFLPLRVHLVGPGRPALKAWRVEHATDAEVVLRWEGEGLEIIRRLEPGQGPYQLWSTMRIVNKAPKPRKVQLAVSTHHYVRREDEKGGLFAVRPAAVSHGVCRYDDSTEREDREALLDPHGFGPAVRFAGIENMYFGYVLAAHGAPASRCELSSSDRGGSVDEPDGSLFEARLLYPEVELEPGQSTTYQTLAYIGPKFDEALRAAGHELREVVDLGFFSTIASALVSLLRTIHGFAGNWGVAIILLTLLVKLVLYPLTEKSFRSMARMRILKPEMDRINELYKDDREKKGAAIMELYRKHKINPLGGCLPQLMQLPIWWALYTSLSTNVELYNAPFALWWTDLSSPDPYFTLPVVLGALMFVQQKISPTAMDPTQAKVMLYFMPVMITGFMLFLPAGLCLYMVTNSTLGIAQQQFIHYRLDRQTSKTTGPSEQKSPEAGSPADTQPSSPPRSSKPGSRAGHRRHRRGRA